MSNALLALLIAVSGTVWIYSKMMRKTGGISGNSITVAAVLGVFIFVIVLIIANMLL